jgi:serine-type D-Ala-D-Ala carboxypeptidase (penicillin-binding protein 5/6)
MGMRESRTQGALIAALFARVRTRYRAAQRFREAGTSFFSSPKRVCVALLLFVAVLATALGAVIVVPTPSSALASGPLFSDITKSVVFHAAEIGEEKTPPHISAKAAILVDMATRTALYTRNADTQLEMASTTKMMTAILILESLPLDKKVKVPLEATGLSGSVLGLRKGETFTVETLLKMMLIPSANDAACTLAVAKSGSVKAFVAEMNARAEKMGLKNTHFMNAWGIHAEGHYSSARDLSVLAATAMQNETFRQIVSTREFTVPMAGGIANRLIKTSNELLRDYDWVNGIKTGSTPWAGYCLASSATKDGLTLISIVLGAKDEDTRESESKALLEYGFDRCERQSLVDSGAAVADVPLVDPLGRQVRLVTKSSFSRRLLGSAEVTGTVKLSDAATVPIEAGQVLGELQFTQGDAGLGSVPLVAEKAIGAPSIRMIMDAWQGPWMSAFPLAQFLASNPG